MCAVQAGLNQKLRESLDGHPWLDKAFLEGRTPSPTTTANYGERIDGLIALVGGLLDVVNQLAVEIDSLKGHTHPSQG